MSQLSRASSALRAFGVEGFLRVLEQGEHQPLEVAVVDFVLEDGHVAGCKEALAVLVEGLEDEELEGEGVGVVAPRFLLGALALRHDEAVVVEGELVAVAEGDRFLEEAAIGGFEEAVDGSVGRDRHAYVVTYLRSVVG